MLTREGPISPRIRHKFIFWLRFRLGFFTIDVIFFEFVPLGVVLDSLFFPPKSAEIYQRYPRYFDKNFSAESYDQHFFF